MESIGHAPMIPSPRTIRLTYSRSPIPHSGSLYFGKLSVDEIYPLTLYCNEIGVRAGRLRPRKEATEASHSGLFARTDVSRSTGRFAVVSSAPHILTGAHRGKQSGLDRSRSPRSLSVSPSVNGHP